MRVTRRGFHAVLESVTLAALLLSSIAARAATAEDYYQAARKAHEDKDYSSYVENLRKVLDAGTRHPVIYLNLAGGHALLGNSQEAFAWLDRYAALGISAPIEEQPDLKSLRAEPQFQSILQRFKDNLRPTDHSKVAFRLTEARFIAEGVAYDAATGDFFVSSILQKKVVRVKRNGKIESFIAGRKELGPVLGMSVDARNHGLWVSTSSIREIKSDTTPVPSGIYQYDLRKGTLLAAYTFTDSAAHQLGDVVPGPDGKAYTSDSSSGGSVYVTGSNGRLEEFAGSGLFRSPQGLCFSPDGRTLFVADYVRGLFGIDVRTRQSFRLEPPANTTLVGIDGLYMHEGALIATQNGVNPNRVLRIDLQSAGAGRIEHTVAAVTVLESNHALFDEITLGVVARDALYYVANGQFGNYLANPDADPEPPVILELPLR